MNRRRATQCPSWPPGRESRIANAVLRTSNRHELVLYDRLHQDERKHLQSFSQDPEFYGVVRPVAAANEETRTVKAVGRDTALLLLTLRQPGPIPTYLAHANDRAQQLAEITDLILDGVLEVSHQGAFVSGPAVLRLLDIRADVEPGHPLTHLSRRALHYAAALESRDIDMLAWRLYRYNARPMTVRWRDRWPDADALRSALGIARGGHRRRRLHAEWTAWGDTPGWMGWTKRNVAGRPATEPGIRASHKLYLSPTPEAIETTFETLLDRLPATRAQSFKIGSDASGLLRADKIVAYFTDFDRLLAATAQLTPALDGIPAQGVPFTAPIDPARVMSWGMDPPDHEHMPPSQGHESWRVWLVRRLAGALIAAQTQSETAVPPWRFATERVRRLGVDVDRWVPSATLWQAD